MKIFCVFSLSTFLFVLLPFTCVLHVLFSFFFVSLAFEAATLLSERRLALTDMQLQRGKKRETTEHLRAEHALRNPVCSTAHFGAK